MSKSRPTVTPQRIIQIFKEMRFWRRMYFMDSSLEKSRGVVNAAKFWEWFERENTETVKIRFDKNLDKADMRAAFVLRLDPFIRLIASNKKFEDAKRGEWFTSFVLAHEFAHIGLEHSPNSTAAKPFSLYEENGIKKDLVDDVDELEANIGGIFLQVGGQVFDKNIDVSLLLKAAGTNETTLRWLVKTCQLDSVQHLWMESKKIRRVVL